MNSEIALVSFVRIVLIACGKKETVVKNAANKPSIVIPSIIGNKDKSLTANRCLFAYE